MKWVTRTNARMDRAAMVWLIKKYIDTDAAITYLPEGEAPEWAEANGATLFHHPKAEFKNTGFRTGVDALITHHELTDPALTFLQLIHRGAETNDRQITPYSPGLRAIGNGLRASIADDAQYVDAMSAVYDGLYAFCQETLAPVESKGRE
jgi:hypothetical protein